MGFLAVLFLTLISASCTDESGSGSPAPGAISKGQILPGININQLKSIYPQVSVDSLGQVQIEDQIAGLDGEWTYTFSDGILSWATFDALYSDINENTFYFCRNATLAIIEEYTDKLGVEPRMEKGIQVYKDPSVQPHWGYPVIKADWEEESISRSVHFVFQGGKGERFSFRVSIELRKR